VDLLPAFFALALGLAVLFLGFRLFLTLLPIMGFFVGLVAGAQFINYLIDGTGFLQSVLAIVVGLITGVGFAILAVIWWWVGVVIAIGGIGFALGFGILPLFGLDADVLSFIIGLAVAVLFVIAAVVLRLPRALVVAVTALWGSAAVLAGIMVLLNIVEPETLGFGGLYSVMSDSIFWTIAWIVLALVGMAAQIMMSEDIPLVPEDSAAATYGDRVPPRP
jgi:hypothetical protein